MNKQEAINKLNELSNLITELNDTLHNSSYKVLGVKYEEKFKEIKKKTGKLQDVPSIFSNMYNPWPEKRLKQVNEEAIFTNNEVIGYEKRRKSYKIIFLCSIILSGVFIYTNVPTFFGSISLISMIVSGALSWLTNGTIKLRQEKLTKLNSKLEKLTQEAKEIEENFFGSLNKLESEKQNGYQAALKYKEIAAKANDEYFAELENYTKDRDFLLSEYARLSAEMSEYDFIPQKYHHLIIPIIDLLKSGRADSYKEALNMAIAEEKENEERAQRAEEDRRRTMIMEQQAEEERRHNMRMEEEQANANRIQEAQNRAMAEAQQRADKRAKEAHYNAQQMASRRCQSCKKVSHCNMKFGGMENCGAFEPR